MGSESDRNFVFDGQRRTAHPGETILDALARDRLPLLLRSIRYHRPRGPVCGLGYCTGCLVRVNGRPNVRACRTIPGEGDVVATENSWPSVRFDLLGALDFVFPRGLDTLHGFRRPAAAIRTYQRVVRRLAGYGAPPTPESARALAAPALRRSVDVAIVGGGASGSGAAARLLARGIAALVLDRDLAPRGPPGVETLGATTVTFLPPRAAADAPFRLVGFTEPGRGVEVLARRVLVATGGYDASLLFPGNDRPGVMTADGALALAGDAGRPPFAHAVVVGGSRRAAQLLAAVGAQVDAVVAPGAIDPDVTRAAADLEVPLYPRTLVLGAAGRTRVRSLHLRSRGTGAEFSLATDAVLLAHRRIPSAQLLFQAGAKMAWRASPGAYVPVRSARGETSVPGLFAIGEVAGVPPEEAVADGERVADALQDAAVAVPPATAPSAVEGPNELEGYYRELLRSRLRGKCVACPCEDVLLREVLDAHRAGYAGIEVVKRYTGLGTGLCQGRYCVPEALLVLSILERRPPSDVGYITQRPPLTPTPLAALASLVDGAPASGGP